MVDYVWVAPDHVTVTAALAPPADQALAHPDGHCSLRYASDHIPVAVRLNLKRQ